MTITTATAVLAIIVAAVIVALWLVLYRRSPYEPPRVGKSTGRSE